MQRHIALAILATTSFAIALAPEEDRRAILAMAGNFKVTFDFAETFAIAPDYSPQSKPYHEEAFETVILVEDTPERITLQHLLVVGDKEKAKVIKHWAQIWTWQDTRILDYAGSDGADVWERDTVTEEEAKGKWSQLVSSVDDTPRYESLGQWVHADGESTWTSQPTRRPLPRREYEIRDDYDYLVAINRHSLTAQGWVHSQDNRKVVDRDGKRFVLSVETGLNQYTRTDHALANKASEWWQANSTVWNSIRNFWIDAGQQSGPTFQYHTTQNGVGLSRKFSELEKEKPAAEAVSEALQPYLANTITP
jgi:hypothetical protein